MNKNLHFRSLTTTFIINNEFEINNVRGVVIDDNQPIGCHISSIDGLRDILKKMYLTDTIALMGLKYNSIITKEEYYAINDAIIFET